MTDLAKQAHDSGVHEYAGMWIATTEELARFRDAVLEESARAAEAVTARSRWAEGLSAGKPARPCEIAGALRNLKGKQ